MLRRVPVQVKRGGAGRLLVAIELVRTGKERETVR